MVTGLIPAARCSGHDKGQIASRPPSAESRTPVPVTSPVPSSSDVLTSSSACRAYGSSSGTAAAKRRSLSRCDLAPPWVPSRRSAKCLESAAVCSESCMTAEEVDLDAQHVVVIRDRRRLVTLEAQPGDVRLLVIVAVDLHRRDAN